MENQVLNKINAYRQQNGKEPFKLSETLKMKSEAHALAMASQQGLCHSGGAVECISNYDDLFTSWVNSPPHHDIQLYNNTEATVGIYYYNGYYYSVFNADGSVIREEHGLYDHVFLYSKAIDEFYRGAWCCIKI